MRLRFEKSFTFLEIAILAVSLLLAGCYIAAAGHLTRHMLLHIGLMAVFAPLAATLVQRCDWHLPGGERGSFLLWATVLQLALFFLWHAPRTLYWMMDSTVISGVAQASLFLAALAFWLSVLQHTGSQVWRAVVALLLTGKLFCLLALILVFAPRALYSHAGHVHNDVSLGHMNLADQQLAGLLMITACPMTYVLAAVLLVVRWLRVMEKHEQKSSLMREKVRAETIA